MKSLHPAAVLSLWASAAVFVQTLMPPVFWWAALGVVCLAVVSAAARMRRLVRRVRILILVTLIMFGLATPGLRVMPHVGWLPLTWDGLNLGAAHATRLLVMVAFVAWLLERLSNDRLVCALHAIFLPLAPLGVSAERVAVRLTLVFRAVDVTRSAWRAWFLEAESGDGPAHIAIHTQRFGTADRLAFAALLIGVVLWGLW